MNILRYSLIVFLFSSSVVMAAPASDSSIKQLLAVTHARKLVDTMQARIGMIMEYAAKQALKGKPPNAKQQQAIDRMKQHTMALMQKRLSWQILQPMYIRIYKETFTEKEVAGMLAFYKTPAGQAVIHKMPVLMQKIVQESRETATGLSPQMKKIQQEFVSEMDAASK